MEIFGDAEVMRFGDGIQSKEWIQNWIQERQKNYASRHGLGKWMVVVKESGEAIGYCGLAYLPDIAGRAEIALGYRLARRFWGSGFATEAVSAMLEYAFNQLGVRRVVATIAPGNHRSIRVAKKIGMRYEKEVMFPGNTHPDALYTITKKRLVRKNAH